MGCSRSWTGAAVLLAATALAVGAATPAAARNECADDDTYCLASSALRNTNAVRAKRGKPPLAMGPATLLTNTVGHSKVLATNQAAGLVHQTFPDIAAAADCGNAFFSAENLCMYGPHADDGDVTAESITNLENSPPHLKNTLSEADFVTTGVYIDNEKLVWVTQVFGSWTDTEEGRQCTSMAAREPTYGGGGGDNGEEEATPTPAYPVQTQPAYPVETPIVTPAPYAPAVTLSLGSPCSSDSQCDTAAGAYCRAGWETSAAGGVRARCRTFAAPCAACAADTAVCWEGYTCTPDGVGGGTCMAAGDMDGRVNCDAPNDGGSDDGSSDDDDDSDNGGSGSGGTDYYGSDYYGSGGGGVYVPRRNVYGYGVQRDTYGSVVYFRRGGRRSR